MVRVYTDGIITGYIFDKKSYKVMYGYSVKTRFFKPIDDWYTSLNVNVKFDSTFSSCLLLVVRLRNFQDFINANALLLRLNLSFTRVVYEKILHCI